MVLKFSLGIIFSIFLFGAGKSILEIKIIPIKRTKTTKITFIKNLPIAVSFPVLVFFVNCIYFK